MNFRASITCANRQRPIFAEYNVERPLGPRLTQDGKRVEQARFGTSHLSRRTEEHDAHDVSRD